MELKKEREKGKREKKKKRNERDRKEEIEVVHLKLMTSCSIFEPLKDIFFIKQKKKNIIKEFECQTFVSIFFV